MMAVEIGDCDDCFCEDCIKGISHGHRRERDVQAIALFCAACLFMFLISLTYGLDLSPGFF